MLITLNGKETELSESTTILELIQSKELTPETVVVELNKEIVAAEEFETTVINDGDHLEVLRFVGGG